MTASRRRPRRNSEASGIAIGPCSASAAVDRSVSPRCNFSAEMGTRITALSIAARATLGRARSHDARAGRLHQPGRSARQPARARQACADQTGRHRQGHGDAGFWARPPAIAAFDANTWYYISQKTRPFAVLHPLTPRSAGGRDRFRQQGHRPRPAPQDHGRCRDDPAQSPRHAGTRPQFTADRAAHRQFRQASTPSPPAHKSGPNQPDVP